MLRFIRRVLKSPSVGPPFPAVTSCHVTSRHVGFRRAKICQSPDGNAQFHPTGPKVASSRLPISSHVTSDSVGSKFVGSPDGNAQFYPMCPEVASPDGNAQFYLTGPKVASSRLPISSHVTSDSDRPKFVGSPDGNAQFHPMCPKVASPDGNAQFHPTGPKVAGSRLPISSHVTSDSDRPKFVGSPDGNAQFHPMCPKVASPDGNAQFHPMCPKVAVSRSPILAVTSRRVGF